MPGARRRSSSRPTPHSYDRLIRALDALPESSLSDPEAFPWVGEPLIDVTFTGHLHEEHVPDVRAWLDARRA